MEFLSGFWNGIESDFIFYHPSWTGFTTDRHTATEWSGVTDFGRNQKAKTQTEPDHDLTKMSTFIQLVWV